MDLQLISIRCTKTEDTTGADEPYLRIRGREVWHSSMNDGDEKNLEHIPTIRFTEKLAIELWEEDTGFLDPDDHLGTLNIKADGIAGGEQTGVFEGDGAEYALTYQVSESDTTPSSPSTQDAVDLISLECVRPEDNAGPDEAYLRVGDRHVWGPKSMKAGEAETLNIQRRFSGSTRIELWDADVGSFFDKDDLIGSLVVHHGDAGGEQQRELIQGDGAIYELTYRVESSPS